MSDSERLVNLKCNIVVAPVLPWVFEIVTLKVYDVIFLLLAPFMFFFKSCSAQIIFSDNMSALRDIA